MSIISTHPIFRWYACNKITSSPTATYVDSNPDTITRGVGSFVADGLEAGMVITQSGTASNDPYMYTIASVIAAELTLVATDAVVAEGPVACTITGYYMDVDGFEQFPGPFGDVNLVRSGGFDNGFTHSIGTVWLGTAFNVTVNAYAADSVPGTDEYHWFLSQRTDDAARQYVSIVPYTNVIGQTYSGSVTISGTALAATELGVSLTAATPQQKAEVFKHCYLYCIRISDGAIQWLDVLKEVLGASPT